MGNVLDQPEVMLAALPSQQYHRYLLWVSLLWQKRFRLGLCGLVGAVLSIAIAFCLPKEFKSTAVLMPPDTEAGSGASILASLTGGSLSPGAAAIGGSLMGTHFAGATFVGVLGSRTIQDRLIDRFDLRKVYHCRTYFDARKRLAKLTLVDDDRKTGIISITVTDTDPNRARDLAAAYVEELSNIVNEQSTSSARREREFLEGRLKEVKKDLGNAESQLSQFSSSNATLDMQDQGKVMLSAAASVQGELIAAESELRGLQSIYGADNVRVRTVQGRIAELRSQLEKMSGSKATAASDLGSDQLYPSLRQLPRLGATYYDLYRQTKIQESVYEVLTNQYELAKVQEAKEIPAVKILDRPVVPERKSYPPRTLIAAFGILLALLAGVGWTFLEERWEQMKDDQPAKTFVRELMQMVLNRSAVKLVKV
jgi:capsule polysaccharide export protein KpsE/RkpR